MLLDNSIFGDTAIGRLAQDLDRLLPCVPALPHGSLASPWGAILLRIGWPEKCRPGHHLVAPSLEPVPITATSPAPGGSQPPTPSIIEGERLRPETPCSSSYARISIPIDTRQPPLSESRWTRVSWPPASRVKVRYPAAAVSNARSARAANWMQVDGVV